MNEVYVIAGGEWLSNNLNAIAAFMSSRTWDSIEKIALTLAVLAVAVMWVQRHNVMDLLGWVAVFVLISLLVTIRTSVQIIDNSDLVRVYRVDNVPVGLALPLSLTTRIGHAMVASYEMIFAQPDSVTYSKTGMLFGAGLVTKSTDFLSRNPEITGLFQDYVQNCVMGDIYLNHKYSLEELMESGDPYTLIFSNPSPLRGVFDKNNHFLTCKDASVTLKDKLNLDTKTGGRTWHYYVQQLFGGRPDPNLLFSTMLGDSYSYFYGSSQSASQIIRQNVTINALRDGITSYAARSGDTASLMNLATTSSMEKQRLAHASIGQVAMRTLPMTQTILLGIAIGIFPLLVLVAVFNKLTLSVLKGYVFALMWLQSWPLLYAILNSAMTFYARQNGVPVVLSEMSQIQLKYSDLATTAGYIIDDDPAAVVGDGERARGGLLRGVQPFCLFGDQPDSQCGRRRGGRQLFLRQYADGERQRLQLEYQQYHVIWPDDLPDRQWSNRHADPGRQYGHGCQRRAVQTAGEYQRDPADSGGTAGDGAGSQHAGRKRPAWFQQQYRQRLEYAQSVRDEPGQQRLSDQWC